MRQLHSPRLDATEDAPFIAESEYEQRVEALYNSTEMDWVVVYGDREHFANLAYLSGFDPRFEEALLLLGPKHRRVLVVGNEGVAYAAVARLPLEVVLCQTFSLMAQQRSQAPRLDDVLRSCGISRGVRVGLVGWKYLELGESEEPSAPAFVPILVVNALHRITQMSVIDVTEKMMDPTKGIRALNSATQIAVFERAASRASEAVFRIVNSARPGVSEFAAVERMRFQGDPLSAHVMFASGKDSIVGLRSPSARYIELGDAATTAVGHWGGLTSRAGLISDVVDEAFLSKFVNPYFSVLATWYSRIRIGAAGGEIDMAVRNELRDAAFSSMLNPGHLTSLDEWMHSPIRANSVDRITSGMVLQCDLIPFPLPPGRALNCEDTIAVADAGLRTELADDQPQLWHRIEARRDFVRTQLGIYLPDEVLPLSNSVAYLPPFWLSDSLVCTISA